MSGLVEPYGVAVPAGFVWGPVDPAAPDDTDPRPCQDPDGVWVVQAAGAGIGVHLGRPGAVMAAVVGERGDRHPETLVAGPAEVHGTVFAGLLGLWASCDSILSTMPNSRRRS